MLVSTSSPFRRFLAHIAALRRGISAAGGPSSGSYLSNPVFQLSIASPTKLQYVLKLLGVCRTKICISRIRLQCPKSHTAKATNLTLFARLADGAVGAQLLTTGPYSDRICGGVTPLKHLDVGEYLAVPSTFRKGDEGEFEIRIYSSDVPVNGKLV